MPYRVLNPALAQAAPVTTLGAPLVNEGETLLTLQTELDRLIGDRDDVDAARIKLWINVAYRQLCASLDIEELNGSVGFNTAIDQPFYLVPRQLSFIRRLAITDTANYPVEEGRELKRIDLSGYRKLNVVDSDTPTRYFRFRKMIVLYPDPDDVYAMALDFKVRPDDLVLDNDSPLLPVEWHEPLSLRARHVAFRAVRMYREAAAAQNDYVMAVRPLLDTDAEERDAMEIHLSPARSVRDIYRGR